MITKDGGNVEMAKGIYELAMALKAYEGSNGEKESIINAMMEATNWSYQIALLYYDMFKFDGIRYWREKAKTWAEHMTEGKEGQAGKDASVDASHAMPLGEGTKDSPYLIENATQLDWFRSQVNGGNSSIHAALIANITYNAGKDVEGYDGKSSNTFTEFTPIASNPTGYSGTFDGRGNTISGLFINKDDSPWCGFFGNVASGGVVKNVIIRNSYISTSHAETTTIRLGGIAGINNGTINDCDVSATIDARSDLSNVGDAYINCGGIVGINNGGTASVSNCITSGSVDVSGTASGEIRCGGIVGYNGSTDAISDCMCSGLVDVSGTATTCIHCGGIVGYNYSTASGCTCSGSVDVSGTATDNINCGGVIGFNSGTTSVSNCMCSGSVNVSGTAMATIYCGGIVGYLGSGTIINCTINGSMDVSGTASASICCGGIVGGSWSTLTVMDCIMDGHMGGGVNVSGNATGNIYCGGIVGATWSTLTITGCTMDGSVNVSGNATNIIYCGGIVSGAWGNGVTLTVTGCTMGGSVNISGMVGEGYYYGGITGYTWAADVVTVSGCACPGDIGGSGMDQSLIMRTSRGRTLKTKELSGCLSSRPKRPTGIGG